MRVVSLAPSATEIVFALRRGDQLVGRTSFCDFPPEAEKIPALGGWTTANLNAVLALKPDLVLTSTFLQDNIATALKARGVTVCHTDPKTLADVLVSFETTAEALGVPVSGRALRGAVESKLVALTPRTYNLSPRVYAEEWPSPPMASGNWVPELIQLAGGVSFMPSGVPSRYVTLEEVQRFDPDVIVLNYCGMKTSAQVQVSGFQSREGWGSLRAARAGRVVVVDDSLLNRPGPRLVEGARALAHAFAGVPAPA